MTEILQSKQHGQQDDDGNEGDGSAFISYHGIDFYLKDASRLLSASSVGAPDVALPLASAHASMQQSPASFCAQYFQAVLSMQHMVGRELAYVTGVRLASVL